MKYRPVDFRVSPTPLSKVFPPKVTSLNTVSCLTFVQGTKE